MSMRRRPNSCGRMRLLVLAIAATWSASVPTSRKATAGEDAAPDPRTVVARERFFEQDVRPLLVEHCYSCHARSKQKGGLRLDSLDAILTGGDSGPAVVPGKADESLLVDAIHYEGPEMPPSGKLGTKEIDILTRWVSLAAPWPARDRSAPHATATAGPIRPSANGPRSGRSGRSDDRRSPTSRVKPPTRSTASSAASSTRTA